MSEGAGKIRSGHMLMRQRRTRVVLQAEKGSASTIAMVVAAMVVAAMVVGVVGVPFSIAVLLLFF